MDRSAPEGRADTTERIRRILHCDMDCFYAAVHMRDDPSLAGRPVVVGGDPGGRGVVASASYEARGFGVHSAMPSARAARLCPHAVFIRPDFSRYRRESERIFALFRDVTELVQPASLDEAYLDVTDVWPEYGSATAVARMMKARVFEETGLTVSVGVAPNKLVAKIASDRDKPDGLTVVKPERVESFLAGLSVRDLHGVGPATEKALSELGAETIADLRELSRERLEDRFGRHGIALWRYARGIDDRPVRVGRVRKSLSTETTYGRDLRDLEKVEEEVERLAGEVARGLEKRSIVGRTVTLKVRYSDFTTVTRSRTLEAATCREADLSFHARRLLVRTEAASRPVRLLGVGVSNLRPAEFVQLPLFPRNELREGSGPG